MANIRIRDLANLASSSASDDFLALDGLANGTRKLNAFSPTFGGNATVGGTLTVNGTSATIGTNTGAPGLIVKGGASGTNGGGYLLVENGSGGSVIGIGNVSAIAGGAFNNDPVIWCPNTETLRFYFGSTQYASISNVGNASFSGTVTAAGTAAVVADGAAGKVTINGYAGGWQTWYGFNGSSGTFRGGFGGYGNNDSLSYYFVGDSYNSNIARFMAGGNLLIGTAVDSGAKLQVGTNTTTAAGGMIFGTDVSLYRSAADTLKTDDAFYIQRDINQEFFAFNAANGSTGTSALVTASVSNGSYGAGFTMGGQNFTNNAFLRGNRLALTGPFDINYVSAQHYFWLGGGGAGTSTAGSQLVFSIGVGGKLTHVPLSFSTASWLTNGALLEFNSATVTNNSTAASGTVASAVAYSLAVPAFAATNASVTTTNAATFYVAGNPVASSNQTFTNAWGIWNAGRTKLGGFVRIDDNSTSSSKDTGCLVVEGGVGVEENVNVGGFYGLVDGIAAPGAATGYARIYVDTADGDLKVVFGDGTVKTLATDS